MYICVCHAITDRQVREVVEKGAASLTEVQAHLPIAGCCGRCEGTARELIDSAQALAKSAVRSRAA